MIRKISLLFILSVVIYACSSSSPSEQPIKNDKFDRGALLKNLADNIIVPSFEDFNTQLTDLKTKVVAFTATPNQTNLDEVRASWYEAYKGWQTVAIYNIGKAEELQFVNHFNIYPLNVADVEANISSGKYDLNISNNHDAQGFPALDYLLYGVASNDTSILAKYTSENGDKYKSYLKSVIAKMLTVNTEIYNNWKNGYAKNFASSTENTATSSLNKFVNDFIYYFEKQLRANKIGIPAGNFSSKTFPEKVEALYRKDISKELALVALTNFKNVFEGKYVGKANASGTSFKTYLDALNREDLAVKIINQLNSAKTAINALGANFSEQIETDNTKMTRAYDELQKVVILLKVDMLQVFNVNVDYVDADGD